MTDRPSQCDKSAIKLYDATAKPKVFLLSSVDQRPHLAERIDALRPVIADQAEIVGEDSDFSGEVSAETDFVIVLGGDGSILRAAKRMGNHQRPVLGVNLGKLGFLADIRTEALGAALQSIINNQYCYIDHMMMNVQVFRDDKQISENVGLNELAILGGPPFDIQKIDLFVDGKMATSYSCDGLIISTPVGSTAYNLSAGGPILRKDLQAFVISPISPHTLTVRPVVDCADRIYEFVVTQPNASTSAALDGQVIVKLESTDRVRVTRAKSVFQLIEVSGNNYYRTLREKLGWGGEFKK